MVPPSTADLEVTFRRTAAAMTAYAPVLDAALDPVVAIRFDGTVIAWNSAAEQTFGWDRREAIGADMGTLIVPAKHLEAHRRGMKRYLATGDARVLGQRIEITAMTRDGSEVPVELSITRTSTGEDDIFIGFLRDISGRRQAEQALERRAREAELLYEVTRLAAETGSFDEALYACLRAICSVTQWPVGHAFVVGTGAKRQLVPSDIWFEKSLGASRTLQDLTRGMTFSVGEGLPGIVLDTGEPTWISDVENDPKFLRKGSGFGAAFGFPIKSEGEIIAVLEFFTTSVSQVDDELMLTVRTLGEQLGRVMERKRTEEHQRLLLNELNHRVKNTLAVVQAIANQTFKGDTVAGSARQAFEGRLAALAEAHDLLTGGNWESAWLQDIVERSADGCGAHPGRVRFEGPEVRLQPQAAISLAMALHELCTNAVKYGALSNSAGSVSVSWQITGETSAPRLSLTWQEVGGPPVSRPAKRGFGTRMIEQALASQLQGSVDFQFLPSGVLCRIEAPLLEHTKRQAKDQAAVRQP